MEAKDLFTWIVIPHGTCLMQIAIGWFPLPHVYQTGRSPKVVALFSATNFSSYNIELSQLHDAIKIK